MGKLLEGGAAGSTPNDTGTQAAGNGGADVSESAIVAKSESYSPGKAKNQGFQDVAGTSADGSTKG